MEIMNPRVYYTESSNRLGVVQFDGRHYIDNMANGKLTYIKTCFSGLPNEVVLCVNTDRIIEIVPEAK